MQIHHGELQIPRHRLYLAVLAIKQKMLLFKFNTISRIKNCLFFHKVYISHTNKDLRKKNLQVLSSFFSDEDTDDEKERVSNYHIFAPSAIAKLPRVGEQRKTSRIVGTDRFLSGAPVRP